MVIVYSVQSVNPAKQSQTPPEKHRAHPCIFIVEAFLLPSVLATAPSTLSLARSDGGGIHLTEGIAGAVRVPTNA